MIAPYKVSVPVVLYKSGDLPTLKQGIRMAKAGQWDGAIEAFKQAVELANGNPKISDELRAKAYYNLGVARGYSGKYDMGIKDIRRANRFYPLKHCIIEINQIMRFKKDAEKLRRQSGK